MKRVNLGNHTMVILGTVQGLVREQRKVKAAYDELKPDMVALPISNEMLTGLKAVVQGEVMEVATNSIDDLFADHLRRFGEVQLPPPSLVEAYRLADEHGVQITTLDMTEEDYAKAYTDHVSGWHYWRRIWNLSKLAKKTFVADTPEEFVVIWDAYNNRLKGYADLEKYREGYMAKKALRLLRKHERVLILVEYERMEGVALEIEKLASEPWDQAADEAEEQREMEAEKHGSEGEDNQDESEDDNEQNGSEDDGEQNGLEDDDAQNKSEDDNEQNGSENDGEQEADPSEPSPDRDPEPSTEESPEPAPPEFLPDNPEADEIPPPFLPDDPEAGNVKDDQ